MTRRTFWIGVAVAALLAIGWMGSDTWAQSRDQPLAPRMYTWVDSGDAPDPLDCEAVYLDAYCDRDENQCQLNPFACCCLQCTPPAPIRWCFCVGCQIIPGAGFQADEQTDATGKAIHDGDFSIHALGRDMTFVYDMVDGWILDGREVYGHNGLNGFIKPGAPVEAHERRCVPAEAAEE